MKNLFITFEGLDGCGKTTQAKLLKEFFEEKNYSVFLTREPGGTPFGELIRDIILDPNNKIHPWTEALLYFSSRLENSLMILKKLKEDYIVICERYIDSTIAYQGYGRGLPIEELKRINNIVTFNLKPSITFFLDLDPEIALKRKKYLDRIEKEDIEFYNRVREGYKRIAQEEKDRFYIISGDLPINDIHKEIVKVILNICIEVNI